MVKGGSLTNGSRHNILNISLWRKFKRETGIEMEYRDFVSIIELSIKRIKYRILNNTSGFKLPSALGYMAVSRYKSKERKIDWNKTKILGKRVYHTNFHSHGYDARLVWYTKNIAHCRHADEYKFVPDREFQKMKSKKLIEGMKYNEYTYADFKSKKIRLNLDKLFYGDAARK